MAQKSDRFTIRPKKAKGSMHRYGIVVRSVLIWVATYLIVFTLISAGITPKRVDLKVGAPAPVTIMATKDVEDVITTERMQEEAVAAVETSYKSVDNSVLPDVLKEFGEKMKRLNELRDNNDGSTTSQQVWMEVSELLDTQAVTTPDVQAYMDADEETITALKASAEQLLKDTMLSTVPEGSEQTAIDRVKRDLRQLGYSEELTTLATAFIADVLRPNMLIDTVTTELNREAAREQVQTQICVKGEVIVREGEIVTRAQYAMASSLGLISNEKSYDFWLIGGVALMVAALFGGIIAYMYIFEPPLLTDMRTLLLIAVIDTLVLLFSLVLRQLNVYFMPVALGVFLITQLIKPRLALIVNISQAIMVSLLASTESSMFSVAMFSVIMSSVVSSSIVVAVSRRNPTRTGTVIAGLVVAMVNFIITCAVGFISSTSLNTVLLNSLWSAGSGLLSAVLCIGIQPALEALFNLVTNSKLIELSSPNHPLLRRLMIEAPGTYHHSVVVANLAEAACTAVGANAMLARVGAYYHDVGKLMRPLYFTENQRGDNPHDRTDPRVSSAILTAHTREGAQLARKAHLPNAIIDIILQHHGDTPTLFFYDRAVKQDGAENVDISQFRYEGPRPQTKEAAIVMMADTLEAASRSLANPTREKLDELIRKLVRGKLDDGQMNECPLTIQDIAKSCEAFLAAMDGSFHSRIEYPDVKVPPKTISGQPENENAAKPVQGAANAAVKLAEAKPQKTSAPLKTVEETQGKPTVRPAEVQPRKQAAEKPAEEIRPKPVKPETAKAADLTNAQSCPAVKAEASIQQKVPSGADVADQSIPDTAKNAEDAHEQPCGGMKTEGAAQSNRSKAPAISGENDQPAPAVQNQADVSNQKTVVKSAEPKHSEEDPKRFKAADQAAESAVKTAASEEAHGQTIPPAAQVKTQTPETGTEKPGKDELNDAGI